MKRFVLFLLMMALLISGRIPAQEPSASGQPSSEKAESQVKVPNLSEIIPLSAELSGRLAELEQKVQGRLNVKSIQEKCADIEANLEKHTLRLNQLKEADDYKASKFLILKQHIDTEDEKLDLISKEQLPIAAANLAKNVLGKPTGPDRYT